MGKNVMSLIYDKNVFELWLQNSKKLPFYVRRWNWRPECKFLVTTIKITQKQLDYFKRKEKIYGKAYGFFQRNTNRFGFQQLDSAGCYQWVIDK